MSSNFFKNFFKHKIDNTTNRIVNQKNHKVDKEGRVHVAMHTDSFSQVGENLLTSNSMFANLVTDILPCIEPLGVKEKITIDAYESKKIDDINKKVFEVGFRKYVNSCLTSLRKQLFSRLALFGGFFILGIIIEFILYKLFNGTAKEMWIFKSAEVLASLFIWQFGGYVAFEFLGARKTIKRYKQIENAKFVIKLWE